MRGPAFSSRGPPSNPCRSRPAIQSVHNRARPSNGPSSSVCSGCVITDTHACAAWNPAWRPAGSITGRKCAPRHYVRGSQSIERRGPAAVSCSRAARIQATAKHSQRQRRRLTGPVPGRHTPGLAGVNLRPRRPRIPHSSIAANIISRPLLN